MTTSCPPIPVPAVPPKRVLLGSLCALVTVVIWSGWNIVTRLGATQALTAAEITFLRFTIAGLISFPILWRYRQGIIATPKYLLGLMLVGAGAPYVLAASAGFQHAPASHGVLIPGAMTLWVALLSYWWLGDALRPARVAGYGLIGFTIIYRLWTHSAGDWAMLLSDGWFLVASILWAIYTVSNKRAALAPLAAVAVVASGSFLFYCIPYALINMNEIAQLPVAPSLVQIVYQGIVVSFIALVCYNHAIAMIGAARASAFAALIPATTMVMAIPLLGEMPLMKDILFVAVLSLGVLLATGLLARQRA